MFTGYLVIIAIGMIAFIYTIELSPTRDTSDLPSQLARTERLSFDVSILVAILIFGLGVAGALRYLSANSHSTSQGPCLVTEHVFTYTDGVSIVSSTTPCED